MKLIVSEREDISNIKIAKEDIDDTEGIENFLTEFHEDPDIENPDDPENPDFLTEDDK